MVSQHQWIEEDYYKKRVARVINVFTRLNTLCRISKGLENSLVEIIVRACVELDSFGAGNGLKLTDTIRRLESQRMIFCTFSATDLHWPELIPHDKCFCVAEKPSTATNITKILSRGRFSTRNSSISFVKITNSIINSL